MLCHTGCSIRGGVQTEPHLNVRIPAVMRSTSVPSRGTLAQEIAVYPIDCVRYQSSLLHSRLIHRILVSVLALENS